MLLLRIQPPAASTLPAAAPSPAAKALRRTGSTDHHSALIAAESLNHTNQLCNPQQLGQGRAGLRVPLSSPAAAPPPPGQFHHQSPCAHSLARTCASSACCSLSTSRLSWQLLVTMSAAARVDCCSASWDCRTPWLASSCCSLRCRTASAQHVCCISAFGFCPPRLARTICMHAISIRETCNEDWWLEEAFTATFTLMFQ